jgi:putative membrane protein
MRFSLILALFLAFGTVVFALQNPGYTDLTLGPFNLHSSTALLLIGAVTLGAIISSLVMLPGRLRKRKVLKNLRQSLHDVKELKAHNETASQVHDSAYDQTDQNLMESFPASDPRSASSLSRADTVGEVIKDSGQQV